MKKQLYKKRIILFLAVVAVVAAVLSFAGGWAARSETVKRGYAFTHLNAEYSIKGTELAAEYCMGSEIEIPDVYFNTADGDLKAAKTVVFPDGTAYSSDKIIASQMGLYRVEYAAKSGTDWLSAEKEFYVYQPLYETSGSISSAVYTANPLTPETSAINVQLASGAEFRYNRIIDLNELSADESLISLYVTPEVPGERDFAQLSITLTDLYDESNYVKIIVVGSTEGRGHIISYVRAGAALQPASGWEGSKLNVNRYGTPVRFSFYGSDGDGQYSESFLVNNKLELFFDNDELQLLTPYHSTQIITKVIDFDDPTNFSDVWSGFTTGDVRLSIVAEDLQKGSAQFAITRIAGHDLSSDKLYDREKPTICVDLPSDNVPVAVRGRAYSLFAATASDQISGAVPVSVRVYADYYQPYRTEYGVTDGCFTPDRVGTYYAVYTARDTSGNTQEQVITIDCVAETAPVSVAVEEDGRVLTGYTGTSIPVAGAAASGGSGTPVVNVAVTDESGEPVELANGAFRPLSPGLYTVLYTATDYVAQTDTDSYTVQIENGADPVFESDPAFPKYFIAGKQYFLPALTAYDYSDGNGGAVETEITVTDDGGTRTLGSTRSVYFAMDGTGTATVTYTARTSAGLAEKSYTVSVFDVSAAEGGTDVSKYFACYGDVNGTSVEKTVVFTALSDSGIEFINPLVAENFELKFSTDPVQSSFGKINIYLIDASDSSKALKFTYRKVSAARTAFSVNDGVETNMDFGFGSENNDFRLLLSVSEKRASCDGNSYLSVSTFTDGTAFTGFPSGKVYMYVAFEEVTAAGTIIISSINSQTTGIVALDRVSPRITIPAEAGGTALFGEKAHLLAPVVGDVLDPNVTATLTVIGPDRQTVVATDGTVLNGAPADRDYYIDLTQYGIYSVQYTAKDTSDRTDMYNYTLTVVDKTAPEITLQRANVTSASVGDTVILASASASDNVTAAAEMTIYRFVITPGGQYIYLDESSNSFVAAQAGVYKIVYTAYDASGNMAMVENTLTVS